MTTPKEHKRDCTLDLTDETGVVTESHAPHTHTKRKRKLHQGDQELS